MTIYGLVAVGAVVVGLIQFRHGIVPLLDSVTYWSSAETTSKGHPFTTNLAPSFSNFSAIEFLARSGRLPFVDFPVGYPTVAGILGSVIGVRRAMELLCIVALVAIAMAFIKGATRSSTSLPCASIIGGIGLLMTMLPTTRLVTQGALSEPLFCAVLLWFVITLADYRTSGRWNRLVLLTVTLGLLRFIGAPLALLVGWERFKRTGEKLKSFLWAGALMLPALINVAWASASGGGHNAGWRGLSRFDIEIFVRSIGGWFDATQGDLRRTYFTTEGPSWWSWLVTLAWLTVIVFALQHNIRRHNVQRRHQLVPTAEIALVSAGIISSGLVAGMMGFDALVIADNRLMMPTGILTMAALVWIAADKLSSLTFGRALPITMSAVLAFTVCAVRPWNLAESFSTNSNLRPYSEVARQTGAAVIITNDADGIHWDTGLPTAYAPLPINSLTGKKQNMVELYDQLPCALLTNKGAVVLSTNMTFSAANIELLDRQVLSGRLTNEMYDGASVYLPTNISCD